MRAYVCVWACARVRAPEEGAEGTAPRLSVIGSVTIPCTWWWNYHSTTRRANAHVNVTAVSFWKFSYKEKLFKAEPGCPACYVCLQFYLFVLNFIAPGTSGIGLIPKKASVFLWGLFHGGRRFLINGALCEVSMLLVGIE